ncbi:hypothetical protein CGCF413_v003170 [Colletotrichum fructicola]|nr:hypothetical protein CGCF413_v003170 [Colletotrichum fructicola]
MGGVSKSGSVRRIYEDADEVLLGRVSTSHRLGRDAEVGGTKERRTFGTVLKILNPLPGPVLFSHSD